MVYLFYQFDIVGGHIPHNTTIIQDVDLFLVQSPEHTDQVPGAAPAKPDRWDHGDHAAQNKLLEEEPFCPPVHRPGAEGIPDDDR